MTFFLTGIYLLPKDKSDLYQPPQHTRGSAAIGYPTDEHIREHAGAAARRLAGGQRDRHPLQRPLLRPQGRRRLERRRVEERDRPGVLVRGELEDQHRLHRRRAAALRLRQGTGRRPRPLPGGPEEPADRPTKTLRLALRRELPGRLPDLAVEEGRHLGLPAPAAPVPGRASSRSCPWTSTSSTTSPGDSTEGDPAKYAAVAAADPRGLPERLRPRLQRQPGAAVHRQPLRGLERRHLHEGRRGRHRGRLPSARTCSACPSRSSPTGSTSRTRRSWTSCATSTRRSHRTGRRS